MSCTMRHKCCLVGSCPMVKCFQEDESTFTRYRFLLDNGRRKLRTVTYIPIKLACQNELSLYIYHIEIAHISKQTSNNICLYIPHPISSSSPQLSLNLMAIHILHAFFFFFFQRVDCMKIEQFFIHCSMLGKKNKQTNKNLRGIFFSNEENCLNDVLSSQY